MQQILSRIASYNKSLFILLLLFCFMPGVSPAIALFGGLLFALLFPHPYAAFSKEASKYLLQFSVVMLGFGMNLQESLKTGGDGMLFTIVSVVSVMLLGTGIGKLLHIDKKIAYLISSGTAICGGSAIAAVGPVVKADDNQMSVSLGCIFLLNAVALFLFPPIGRLLEMTQADFGLWAAIAIHDTSSVVGAGAAYGEEALQIATMVKLTRALWIIPLSFVTTLFFKEKSGKRYTPWFIFYFVLAMIFNTYIIEPNAQTLPWLTQMGSSLGHLSKQGLSLTLFLIGTGLSLDALKKVGIRPLVQGVLLWIFIAILSLSVILFL